MANKSVKKIPVLRVRSVSKAGFRRCGLQFGPEGRDIPCAELSKEDIAILKDERELVVQEVVVESEADASDAKPE